MHNATNRALWMWNVDDTYCASDWCIFSLLSHWFECVSKYTRKYLSPIIIIIGIQTFCNYVKNTNKIVCIASISLFRVLLLLNIREFFFFGFFVSIYKKRRHKQKCFSTIYVLKYAWTENFDWSAIQREKKAPTKFSNVIV